MPRPKMTLARLLIELRESFPSPIHIPEDAVELSISHEDSRDLHNRLTDLLDKEEQLKGLAIIVERTNPLLFNSLCASGFFTNRRK